MDLGNEPKKRDEDEEQWQRATEKLPTWRPMPTWILARVYELRAFSIPFQLSARWSAEGDRL